MATVEVLRTLEYRGGQLNAALKLEMVLLSLWQMVKGSQKDNRLHLEINTGFINGLPKKWLSFCQSLRNTNHVKDFELASLFGKLKYEENLIDSIYEIEKSKSFVFVTPLSTAFPTTSIVQDFQDKPDDEEDTRSSHKYLNYLEEEYQAKALLAKSKRFFKKVPSYQSPFQPKLLHPSEHKPEPRLTKDFKSKYNKVKAKLALFSSSVSAPSLSSGKNKGLTVETYDWDEEEVSSDDNEVTEVKALMALTDEERVSVGKESANNGEWVKISIQKVHTHLEIEDNDDRKSFLDYLCIDLNYVEEQRDNLLSKHRNLVHELNTYKEQLLVLKQAKLDLLTMQHVNSEILKENQNLRNELKELTSITKAWLNSTSSSRPKDLVFVKSSPGNSEMSITGSNKPKLSGAEDFTLSNHDTGKVPSNESQRNTTDHSVVVSNSSVTDYDSADESLVCSTTLPPLEKLTGAETVSGPKTIKIILKSKSTFKAETLKGITINKPSLALARRNKSSSASQTNSAPLEESNLETLIILQRIMKHVKASKTESSNALRSKTHNKREPLTRSPNMYKEYLAEFWYLAKALEYSKVSFFMPTGGIYNEVGVNNFRNAIGAHYIAHYSKYVAPPSIDVVRPCFETIRYGETVPVIRTLKKSLLPSRWSIFWEDIVIKLNKIHREKIVPYTRFLSLLMMHNMKEGFRDGNDASKVSTAEADPGNSAPSDFANSVARQIKEETYNTIKLEDLAKLVSHVQPSFKDLDSPEDDHVIIVDDTDEDEIHATANDETKDTLVPKSSSPKSSQIQELTNQLNKLLVKSLKIKFSNILSAHDFSSSLPTELKDLPSKFNELTEEVKVLKKQVNELEIDLPGDLNEIPTKLEDFRKTVTSLTSQVAKLKTLRWELPTKFLSLPVQVASVQAKLKTLDALPGLLLNVTQALISHLLNQDCTNRMV
nr:hypothetical protein [Tanacetum cinerariifolium]